MLPEFALIMYLAHGNHLPESDGAEYFLYGYRVYERFRHGLWEGLQASYFIRSWKPTIFPIFVTPALLLTGGKLYGALSAAVVFIYGYTILYSFVLLKERLSTFSAAIGSAMAAVLPLLLFLAVDFYSEIAMPGLIVGVVYHLLKSEDFSVLGHVVAAAVLIALLICIRPDQALLTLAPLLILVIGVAVAKKRIAVREIVLCCLVVLLTGAVFILQILHQAGARSFPTTGGAGTDFLAHLAGVFTTLTITALMICALLTWALARKMKSAAYAVVCFVSLICTLSMLWFFPFALATFEWMYRCTFGDLAQSTTGGQELGSFWNHTWQLTRDTGDFVIISAVVIAVFGLIAHPDVLSSRARGSFEKRAIAYLVVSVSPLFGLMLLGTGLSRTFWANDPYRRLMSPFCVLVLTLLLIGLLPGRHLKLRQAVALLVLLVQVTAIDLRSFGMDSALAASPIFVSGLGKPRLLEPEPNGVVISELDRLAQTEPVTMVDIEGYHDVSVGGVLLIAEQRKYVVRRDYANTYGGPEELDDFARRSSHVVFSISPPTNGVPERVTHTIRDLRHSQDPNYLRQADILQLLYSGGLERHGLQFIRTMLFGPTEVYFFRSLVYAKATSESRASATATGDSVAGDNLAAARQGARAIAANSQAGTPASNLNDGTPAPWGSIESVNDVYAGFVLSKASAVREFEITIFAPGNGQHLRDISVVAADSEGIDGPVWVILRSRTPGQSLFNKKTTVPQLDDGAVARIEIDRGDPNWRPHRIWGIACFSRSQGYVRNYLKSGLGIYMRELEMR